MERIVIVGAGLAGHRAATALRTCGFAGDLTVVGDEPHLPYDRPPLSKQVLAGVMEHERLFFPVEDLGAKWLTGLAAARLDGDRRVVELEGGGEVPYDGLIAATGRRARPWPTDTNLAGVHVLRGLDHARSLAEELAAARDVVIVGAGFVGCEVAATVRVKHPQAKVTVVDIAELPMTPLGAEVGRRALSLHRAREVDMRMKTSILGFEGDERVRSVSLDDGDSVPADVVLLALGSLPNTEWLADSGAQFENGAVLCDAYCAVVGLQDLFAAGDAAAFPHGGASRTVCIEHWSNARDMGDVAARNLLAADDERVQHVPTPTFWSDQYDVKLKSAGFVAGAETYDVVEEDTSKNLLVVEVRTRGQLVGAITLNANKRLIQYQRELTQSLKAGIA